MKSKEDCELYAEIRDVINKYSRERYSDTPDNILANYLMTCLKAYEEAVKKRDKNIGI